MANSSIDQSPHPKRLRCILKQHLTSLDIGHRESPCLNMSNHIRRSGWLEPRTPADVPGPTILPACWPHPERSRSIVLLPPLRALGRRPLDENRNFRLRGRHGAIPANRVRSVATTEQSSGQNLCSDFGRRISLGALSVFDLRRRVARPRLVSIADREHAKARGRRPSLQLHDHRSSCDIYDTSIARRSDCAWVPF